MWAGVVQAREEQRTGQQTIDEAMTAVHTQLAALEAQVRRTRGRRARR
jgi:hypothetical protein